MAYVNLKKQIESKLKRIISVGKSKGYGWYETDAYGIGFNESNSWNGWYNQNYDYGRFYSKLGIEDKIIERIYNEVNSIGNGWKAIYNLGENHKTSVWISYIGMTKEEVDRRATEGLYCGHRESD